MKLTKATLIIPDFVKIDITDEYSYSVALKLLKDVMDGTKDNFLSEIQSKKKVPDPKIGPQPIREKKTKSVPIEHKKAKKKRKTIKKKSRLKKETSSTITEIEIMANIIQFLWTYPDSEKNAIIDGFGIDLGAGSDLAFEVSEELIVTCLEKLVDCGDVQVDKEEDSDYQYSVSSSGAIHYVLTLEDKPSDAPEEQVEHVKQELSEMDEG